MTTRRRRIKKRTVTLTFSIPSRLSIFHRPRMSPKRKAVLNRFVKFVLLGALGAILAVAGFAVMQILTDSLFPQWLVMSIGVTVSGIAASIQKAVNWKAAGVEPPVIPDVSAATMSLTPSMRPTNQGDTQ